jgi:rubrerythrin
MDMFEFAMKMEEDGEAFYRKMASDVKDDGIKVILNMLADDEVKHYTIFMQMKRAVVPSMAETKVLSGAKSVFQGFKGRSKEFDFGATEIDHLRKAREIEKKSEDFYREKAREVEIEGQRDLLLRIADEEKKHYFLLENMLQFMSRPKTWLEDAEFNHLDEY